eukprot:1136853-Pelagomonas_calceolata.AAC.3
MGCLNTTLAASLSQLTQTVPPWAHPETEVNPRLSPCGRERGPGGQHHDTIENKMLTNLDWTINGPTNLLKNSMPVRFSMLISLLPLDALWKTVRLLTARFWSRLCGGGDSRLSRANCSHCLRGFSLLSLNTCGVIALRGLREGGGSGRAPAESWRRRISESWYSALLAAMP